MAVKHPMDYSPRTLGERVRIEREKRGMSQVELAAIAGIKQGTLSQIETGKTKEVEARTVLGLAHGLKTTARYLRYGWSSHAGAPILSWERLKGVYDALSPESRDVVLVTAEALLSKDMPDPEPPRRPALPRPNGPKRPKGRDHGRHNN